MKWSDLQTNRTTDPEIQWFFVQNKSQAKDLLSYNFIIHSDVFQVKYIKHPSRDRWLLVSDIFQDPDLPKPRRGICIILSMPDKSTISGFRPVVIPQTEPITALDSLPVVKWKTFCQNTLHAAETYIGKSDWKPVSIWVEGDPAHLVFREPTSNSIQHVPSEQTYSPNPDLSKEYKRLLQIQFGIVCDNKMSNLYRRFADV